jgi:hypothetical protein
MPVKPLGRWAVLIERSIGAPERYATKPIYMGFHQVAYEIGAQTFLSAQTGQTRMSVLRDTETRVGGFCRR